MRRQRAVRRQPQLYILLPCWRLSCASRTVLLKKKSRQDGRCKILKVNNHELERLSCDMWYRSTHRGPRFRLFSLGYFLVKFSYLLKKLE